MEGLVLQPWYLQALVAALLVAMAIAVASGLRVVLDSARGRGQTPTAVSARFRVTTALGVAAILFLVYWVLASTVATL